MKWLMMAALLFAAHTGFAQEDVVAGALPNRTYIELPPEVLQEYEGVYFWPPHKSHIYVFFKDGKLYGKPQDKIISELKPFEIDQFMIDGVWAELHFSRDPEGAVNQVVLVQDTDRNVADRLGGEQAKKAMSEFFNGVTENIGGDALAGHKHDHGEKSHKHDDKKQDHDH